MTGSVGAEQYQALAMQVMAIIDHGVPEVAVDARGVQPPLDQLAGVLHGCAELLAWAGGALILTNAPHRLVRRLRDLSDPEELVVMS